MRLEDIGFYTLSDYRAQQTSVRSPLWRAELLLSDRCNFKCPYCRGLQKDQRGDILLYQAEYAINLWTKHSLKNLRFSGGEPTLYKHLPYLAAKARSQGVKRIAISTNGSAPTEIYKSLLSAGVNDFSISLDGSCCAVADKMCGVSERWPRVVENIKYLSKRTYVTVGCVFTEENVGQAIDVVMFASSLGVSDIRVIPSAQYNQALQNLSSLPQDILNKFPILSYRINRIKNNLHVRGILSNVHHPCYLVLDDLAVVKGKHYPCIIYLREKGKPIGSLNPTFRSQRLSWMATHKPWLDPICRKNCLDVCCDYNLKVHTRE